ncbi:hypothetical protein B484DRAFT_429332 [Ochromonadaceae sp. CCMP2298]|nr:hypothetical protein B484DRAFT_429332 [Ochromonadaceae sp. CCMP2298]
MSCAICAEDVNRRRTLVCCVGCDFEACRTCCETFILDQPFARCMNTAVCKLEWSRRFLAENVTKTFLNGKWKKKREQDLFDRETALLPATQGVVEHRKSQERKKDEINEMANSVDRKKKELREMERVLYYLRLEHTRGGNVVTPGPNVEINVRRACSDMNCRGYLSADWNCGLCKQSTCSKCHALVVGQHVCNEDDVKTITLLETDTRSCPSCATSIHKISGCDQMWCTQCRTAFSWNTGRIEVKIHNPHYYEWMNANRDFPGRAAGDLYVCGRLLNTNTPLINKINSISVPVANEMQCIIHVCIVNRGMLQRMPDVQNNLELRVDFLTGKCTEVDFKKRLHCTDKKFQKDKEINQVMRLFVDVASEIMLRAQDFAEENVSTANHEDLVRTLDLFFREIDGITEYVEECMKDISIAYNSKLPGWRTNIFTAGEMNHRRSEVLRKQHVKDLSTNDVSARWVLQNESYIWVM